MIDPDVFRTVMGNFAAGVTVVTLPEPFHGITVNAFASISLSPTLVMIAIDHETETHERLSSDETAFCVNILAADQRHLGEHFAHIREHGDPFIDEQLTTATTGAPIFEEALAYLDCTVTDTLITGDHTIYVGEVMAADVQRSNADALTYFRGEWGSLES